MSELNNEPLLTDIHGIYEAAIASLPASPNERISSTLATIQSVINRLSTELSISVSHDLSAIRLNAIPLIFMGSNYWWIHRFTSYDHCKERAINTAQIYARLAPRLSNAHIFHVVIPEKDTLCLELFFGEDFSEYLRINESSAYFVDTYARSTGSSPILLGKDLLESCSGLDFSYYDSHLPTQLYLLFADQVVKTLGGPSDWMDALLPLKDSHKWLDLGKKLDPEYCGEYIKSLALPEYVKPKDCKSNILLSPLRDTKTSSINSNPVIDKKALILGDSHSSIIGASKLTDILSSIFREVDFAWNPYCIHGFPSQYRPDDYEVVIFEISERFIYGVP
jgi:hypothetical protein